MTKTDYNKRCKIFFEQHGYAMINNNSYLEESSNYDARNDPPIMEAWHN